jgi:hypothetical protein
MAVQIQMRRGTLAQWAAANPTLADGEWGLETDTDKFKIGDGSTAWNSITNYSSLGVGTAGGTFAGTINFGADGTGQDVNFYSGTAGDHMKWDASEEQLIIEGTNGTVALHVTDGDVTIADGDLTVSDNLIVTGDFTVNGATTTISTTNTLVEDSLIELNTGASSNANDLGIVMERGSTGNNAIIAWDESADKFTMGTTTATGASTGNLSITAGTLVVDLEGDVTGSVTGAASLNLLKAGGAMTGAITTNSTFDGVDIAVRDAILTSTTTTANAALPKAGGTLSGAVDAGEQIISQAIFKDVGETLDTNSTSGSAATIDLEDGNFHKVTLTANCTLTFSNVPATANTAASFTLFLVQDGTGSRIVTWPGTVDWSGATAPTLTTTAAAVDVLTFITLDGGTIWNGFVAGQAMG